MPTKFDTQYFFFMFWNYKFIYLYTFSINRPYLSKMAVERIFFFTSTKITMSSIWILYFCYKFFPLLLQGITIGPKNVIDRDGRDGQILFFVRLQGEQLRKKYTHTLCSRRIFDAINDNNKVHFVNIINSSKIDKKSQQQNC